MSDDDLRILGLATLIKSVEESTADVRTMARETETTIGKLAEVVHSLEFSLEAPILMAQYAPLTADERKSVVRYVLAERTRIRRAAASLAAAHAAAIALRAHLATLAAVVAEQIPPPTLAGPPPADPKTLS